MGLDNDNTYNIKSVWEGQASLSDESNCEKIVVSRKDSKYNENIFTVIIYNISTGRIRILGKCLH